MNVIRFIVYSNLLISLSAGFLSFGLAFYLGVDNSIYYFFSVFFATMFIYNFQRIPRLDEVNDQYSDRHIWLKKNKKTLYVLIILGLLGAVITYFQFLTIKNDFVFLIIIGVVGILYALKTLRGRALRDFSYIKIHLIVLTWVLMSAVWPMLREQQSFLYHLKLLAGLYLIMLAITIPFDIRDLNYDDSSKKTIPQMMGVRLSVILSSIFLASGFYLVAIYDADFLRNPFFYISFIGFFILILATKQSRKELYFSGWIDGWIVFFGLMFLFAR